MPHDPGMAERIRSYLDETPGLTEKKMFGGIGWMVNGHMAAGAHNDGRLMIRCAKEDHAAFVAEPGARGMIQGGREMRGWVLVDADAVRTDEAMHAWLDRGRAHAASMPPKKK